MKILGHPIHVMLIHFPSALLVLDPLFSALACGAGPLTPHYVFISTGVGVVFGWLAVLTGIVDVLKLWQEKHPAVNRALIHGAVNSTVLMGFTFFMLINLK